jgi:hypothetical protein
VLYYVARRVMAESLDIELLMIHILKVSALCTFLIQVLLATNILLIQKIDTQTTLCRTV